MDLTVSPVKSPHPAPDAVGECVRARTLVPEAGGNAFCETCAFSGVCLATGYGQPELAELNGLLEHVGPFQAGEFVFRRQDAFRAIYAVSTGTLKTVMVTRDGYEQVLGFHLPGEVVGLDAIYPECYPCDAVALETTTCCRFPFQAISTVSARMPDVQQHMFRMLSREVGISPVLLGDHNADERLAAFLVDLANRYAARGASATQFRLGMSRGDIANYLHLAAETVSRVLGRFRDQGLLRSRGRRVEIIDEDGLRDMASRVFDE